MPYSSLRCFFFFISSIAIGVQEAQTRVKKVILRLALHRVGEAAVEILKKANRPQFTANNRTQIKQWVLDLMSPQVSFLLVSSLSSFLPSYSYCKANTILKSYFFLSER